MTPGRSEGGVFLNHLPCVCAVLAQIQGVKANVIRHVCTDLEQIAQATSDGT